MSIGFLLNGFREHAEKEAIIWQEESISYGELLRLYEEVYGQLQERVPTQSVVSLESDFSPTGICALLALIELQCIIVPLTESVANKKDEFIATAEVEVRVCIEPSDTITVKKAGQIATNDLTMSLKDKERPGLILFSSGSTGASKAALHDFVPLLEKFKTPRHGYRTITFLLFDHIGGVNTLFYTLSNQGCIIALQERDPHTVATAIERHQAEILPTSPTFINLLLLSNVAAEFDFSSLQLVTYGTEVMPETTLKRFHEQFPNIRLLQTYGLSEVGILRSKSKSSDSLWVRIGGEGFETRVRDGLLEIKAASAMLGYLNAPSPFTDDGWFKTGDAVEVEGEYYKILGRTSEIINVGGEKVYPAEVEGVVQLLPGVEDVVVKGEANALVGNIVVAQVRLTGDESLSDFKKRLTAHCKEYLERFKIPQKVVALNRVSHGQRFKKMRN